MVNAATLADILGVSRMAISRAVRSGRLTPLRKDDTGVWFDRDAGKAEWLASRPADETKRTAALKTGGRKPKPPLDAETNEQDEPIPDIRDVNPHQAYSKAKAADKTYVAKLRELELKVKRGELVTAKSVREKGGELGSVLIRAIAAFPSRVTPKLAHMNDAQDIHEYLTDELNDMIKAIRLHCGVPETCEDETADDRKEGD